MTKPLKPCIYCGMPKSGGQGRRTCDRCRENAKPMHERIQYQERGLRRQKIKAAERAAGVADGTVRPIRRGDAPVGQKWCNRCEQFLAVSEFNLNGRGPAAYCAPCASAYAHERILARQFGMTPARYQEMLDVQAGRCAICEKRPRVRRLAVDHDHETGEVRGLLCTRCNHKVLGGAGESAALLKRAARYLTAPPARTGKPVTVNEADRTEMRLAEDLDRATAIAGGAGRLAATWYELPGIGAESGCVAMSGAQFCTLLTEAGYITAPTGDGA